MYTSNCVICTYHPRSSFAKIFIKFKIFFISGGYKFSAIIGTHFGYMFTDRATFGQPANSKKTETAKKRRIP